MPENPRLGAHARGVLGISQQRQGSPKFNIKSEKRHSVMVQIQESPWMSQGRTPYVITSETPGPAYYKHAPDANFVAPPLPREAAAAPTSFHGKKKKAAEDAKAAAAFEAAEAAAEEAEEERRRSESTAKRREAIREKAAAKEESASNSVEGDEGDEDDANEAGEEEEEEELKAAELKTQVSTNVMSTKKDMMRAFENTSSFAFGRLSREQQVREGSREPSPAPGVKVEPTGVEPAMEATGDENIPSERVRVNEAVQQQRQLQQLQLQQRQLQQRQLQQRQLQEKKKKKQEEEEDDEDEGWSEGESSKDEESVGAGSALMFDRRRNNAGERENSEEKKWSRPELEAVWNEYDNNNSGQISFAEIEKVVLEKYPHLDNKEVLMRSYTFADADHSGLITKSEFVTFLRCLAFFQKLWGKFEEVDRDGDQSMDLNEFLEGRAALGMGAMSAAEADELFHVIDHDASGKVRFFELCSHLAWREAETQNTHDHKKAERLASWARSKAVPVDLRPMAKLARLPGVDVPIARTGRVPFKHLHSGFATLETVESPGPASYDARGTLLLKQHSVTSRATFGTASRFESGGAASSTTNSDDNSKGGKKGGSSNNKGGASKSSGSASSRAKSVASSSNGPGPGKYNPRDFTFTPLRPAKEGGVATLRSGEARTMLHDNAKRAWGHSKHHNGAFFPPEQDYFQRPSQHAPCANPVSSLRTQHSDSVYSFPKQQRPSVDALPEMGLRHTASEFALATSSASLYSGSGLSGLNGGSGGTKAGGAGGGGSSASLLSVSLLDVPFTGSTLSTEPNAPSSSFGSAEKFVDRTREMAKVGLVGPGPGAYDTAGGGLSSVGPGHKQVVGLPGYGASAHSFGGAGNVPRESNPVLDKRSGAYFAHAARVGVGEKGEEAKAAAALALRETALRGCGFVSRTAVVPGPGAYNADLSGRLDAALALNRKKQLQQYQPPRQSPSQANPSTTAATTSATSAGSTHATDDDRMRRTLAVQQASVGPSYSFAATGRDERAKLFPGQEAFLDLGMFSPDTPGHFAGQFPCPTFGHEKGSTYAHGTGAAFSLGGANNNLVTHGSPGGGGASSLSFPNERLSVLDSVRGEQSVASPYASVPVYSIGTATRVSAAATQGVRTTAPFFKAAAGPGTSMTATTTAQTTAGTAGGARGRGEAATTSFASALAAVMSASSAGDTNGAQAGRMDDEAIYHKHRGGVAAAPFSDLAKKQARNTAFLLPPRSTTVSSSRPGTPQTGAMAAGRTMAVAAVAAASSGGVRASLDTVSSSVAGSRDPDNDGGGDGSGDDEQGGSGGKRKSGNVFDGTSHPHFATTVRAPFVAGGEAVPVDRLWPRDSPGPIRYEVQKSFEALDRGLKPHGKGVKLTLGRRFKADRREDGSVIEHPFDAMETKRKNEKRVDQKGGKKKAAAAAKTTAAAASGESAFAGSGASSTIQRAGAQAISGEKSSARTTQRAKGIGGPAAAKR